MKRVLISLLMLIAISGCGGESYRRTTLTVMETAQKTEDSVVSDMAMMAKAKSVALAKERIKDGADIDEVLGRLMQDLEDIGFLQLQHAIAKNLNGHAWIYVSARKPWIVKAYQDMKGALSSSGNLSALPPSTRQSVQKDLDEAKKELHEYKEKLEADEPWRKE